MSRVRAGWVGLAAGLALVGQTAPHMPMKAELENSAESAWLKKKVLEERRLGGGGWEFRGQGKVSFEERADSMLRARMDVDLQTTRPTGWSGAPAAALTRTFEGEDWSRFNRIAFRVRAQMRGFHTLTLVVAMRNDGKEKVPDVYQREGGHYVTVANNRWTEVRWEIPNLGRDKVTSLSFRYFAPKTLPAEEDSVSIEIEEVRLERVEADAYEGWGVGAGKIAYSHSGYEAEATKTALASGLKAVEFSVVEEGSGTVVLKKAVKTVRSRLGEFQVMDFSELKEPGRYRVRAGGCCDKSFSDRPRRLGGLHLEDDQLLLWRAMRDGD